MKKTKVIPISSYLPAKVEVYRMFYKLDNYLVANNLKAKIHFSNYFNIFGESFIEGDALELFKDFSYKEKIRIITTTNEGEPTRKGISYIKSFLREFLINVLSDIRKNASLTQVKNGLEAIYEYNSGCYLFFKEDLAYPLHSEDDEEFLFNDVLLFMFQKNAQLTEYVQTYENRLFTSTTFDKNMLSNIILKKMGEDLVLVDEWNLFSNRVVRSSVSDIMVFNSKLNLLNSAVKNDELLANLVGVKNTMLRECGKEVIREPERDRSLTKFDIDQIYTVHCSITATPILLCKSVDFLSYHGINSSIVIYEDGYAYMKYYKNILLAKTFKLRTKKLSQDSENYYVFGENEEEQKLYDDNYKKLKNSEKSSFKKVFGYGAGHNAFRFFSDNLTEHYQDFDKLYMGVEMEFDGAGQSDDNNELFLTALTKYLPIAYSTRDGSLRNGFETKTLPSTLSVHMNKKYLDYEPAFKLLKHLGYRSSETETCGLHVHLSSAFFTNRFLHLGFNTTFLRKMALTLLTLIVESNWENLVVFTRRQREKLDSWATNRHIDTASLRKKLLNKETYLDGLETVHFGYRDRHSALNNSRGETFELRIFRGTLNYTAYMATLQLLENMSYIVIDLMSEILSQIKDPQQTVLKGFTKAFSTSYMDIVNYKHWDELDRYTEKIEAYLLD